MTIISQYFEPELFDAIFKESHFDFSTNRLFRWSIFFYPYIMNHEKLYLTLIIVELSDHITTN